LLRETVAFSCAEHAALSFRIKQRTGETALEDSNDAPTAKLTTLELPIKKKLETKLLALHDTGRSRGLHDSGVKKMTCSFSLHLGLLFEEPSQNSTRENRECQTTLLVLRIIKTPPITMVRPIPPIMTWVWLRGGQYLDQRMLRPPTAFCSRTFHPDRYRSSISRGNLRITFSSNSHPTKVV